MFYWLVKALLTAPFWLLFRPVVRGADHIPRNGGALLASNHLSMSDSLFLPVLTRRRVTFLAKIEYFTGKGVKGRLKAAFVRGTGLVPIDRGDADASAAALRAGVQVLRDGRLLCIYPEGTRSPDGRLYRGKTGVARMALEAGVPIIPVAMVGTRTIQPIGRVVPRLAQVQVRIGVPIHVDESADDPAVLRQVTDQVMAAIAELSGQEQTDEDAAETKQRRRR